MDVGRVVGGDDGVSTEIFALATTLVLYVNAGLAEQFAESDHHCSHLHAPLMDSTSPDAKKFGNWGATNLVGDSFP